MIFNSVPGCCGLRELNRVSAHRTPEDALRSLFTIPSREYGNYTTNKKFRYAVFTQAGGRSTYGKRLAAFIIEHKLGEIVETAGKHINPNSRRLLKAWLWTVDHDALQKWYRDNYPNDVGDVSKKKGNSSVISSMTSPSVAPSIMGPVPVSMPDLNFSAHGPATSVIIENIATNSFGNLAIDRSTPIIIEGVSNEAQ